jgi:hypothetical protein
VTEDEVCTKLAAFVRGGDRSVSLAGEIEVGLNDLFGDSEPFASLVLALASYRPEGGEFMYDEASILPMMKTVLLELLSRQ